MGLLASALAVALQHGDQRSQLVSAWVNHGRFKKSGLLAPDRDGSTSSDQETTERRNVRGWTLCLQAAAEGLELNQAVEGFQYNHLYKNFRDLPTRNKWRST